jgi:phage gpG-like protein
MTALGLSIGTDVEYFKYHQSNKPRKRLPRRAPVLLTADDRHALMRPIRLYLTGQGAYA